MLAEPGVAVFSAYAVQRTPRDPENDDVWFKVIEVGRGDVPPIVYDDDVTSGKIAGTSCKPLYSQYEVGESYVFVSLVGTGPHGPGMVSGDRLDLGHEAVERGLVSAPPTKWGTFGLMVAMTAGAVLVLTVGHRRLGRTS